MINIGVDFGGMGAAEVALKRAGIPFRHTFVCDVDKYARKTFLTNHGTPEDLEVLKTPECKFVDDVYYRLYVDKKMKQPTPADVKKAVELAKVVSRKFSFYYPWNVYEREIDDDDSDLYVSTPPCQSFSMAGNRKGEGDDRGILFYNTHDYINRKRPRFFILENVKGLLSDDKANEKSTIGRTFSRWLDMLGGKSVNGAPVIFPHEESVPYHIYWKVINATEHNVPQNRERVFIVGIRDDKDNDFEFPARVPLERRVRDILEKNVPKKYDLSVKMLKGFVESNKKHNERDNGFKFEPLDIDGAARTITTKPGQRCSDSFIKEGYINQNTQASKVYSDEGISPTISAGSQGYSNGYIKVGSLRTHEVDGGFREMVDGNSPTLNARARQDGSNQPVIIIANDDEAIAGGIRGRDPENPKSRKKSESYQQMFEANQDPSICNTLSTVQKDNALIEAVKGGQIRIRRFTPRECLRLMDYPDTFKIVVADTQAYKQAGNSIVIEPLYQLLIKIKNLTV